MKVFDRIKAWRRQRSREGYERERDWQKSLHDQDAQKSIRDMAEGSAGSQATFPPNQ